MGDRLNIDKLIGGKIKSAYKIHDLQIEQARHFKDKKATLENYGENEIQLKHLSLDVRAQRYFSAFELLLNDNECMTAPPATLEYMAQVAVIAALLDSDDAVNIYLPAVLRKIAGIYKHYFDDSPKERNKLSRSIMTFMQLFGFNVGGPYAHSAQNRQTIGVEGQDVSVASGVFPEHNFERVVLAGEVSTKTFETLIAAGVVFKDGISSVHGEFTHALQWCIVGEALLQGFDFSSYRLKRANNVMLAVPSLAVGGICEVYRRLIRYKLRRGFFLVGEVANPPPGAEGPQVGRQTKTYLWDLVVDSFVPSDRDPAGFMLFNVFSDSCRAPGFIANYIKTSDNGFFNQYYAARFVATKRVDLIRTLAGKSHAQSAEGDNLQHYHRTRAQQEIDQALSPEQKRRNVAREALVAGEKLYGHSSGVLGNLINPPK